MGGFGSGRKSEVKCTDDYWSIDIRHWQRQGNLAPGNYFIGRCKRSGKKTIFVSVRVEADQLRLTYSRQQGDGAAENLNYQIRVQTTSCHYGGVRYWFSCPSTGCNRRVAVLYRNGKYFACRGCYQLVYRSQRETIDYRADRKVNKIKEKLRWPGGILNPIGKKPKGMHRKTYYGLLAEHNDYLNQALLGISGKLLDINNKLRNIEKQMCKQKLDMI